MIRFATSLTILVQMFEETAVCVSSEYAYLLAPVERKGGVPRLRHRLQAKRLVFQPRFSFPPQPFILPTLGACARVRLGIG